MKITFLKKLILKLWNFIIKPRRLEKVKDTADFHKRCEYHQADIQRLFDDGVFDLTNGSATINKDWHGRIRGKTKIEYYV